MLVDERRADAGQLAAHSGAANERSSDKRESRARQSVTHGAHSLDKLRWPAIRRSIRLLSRHGLQPIRVVGYRGRFTADASLEWRRRVPKIRTCPMSTTKRSTSSFLMSRVR